MVAHNTISNSMRSRRRYQQMLARLPEGTHETDPADDITDGLARAQSAAAVRSAFHGLRRQEQEILTLCVLEGFSMADAGQALDIPAAAP
ncbi:RNA polymerase sigma factor [Pseudarthrobacter sp. So.54]